MNITMTPASAASPCNAIHSTESPPSPNTNSAPACFSGDRNVICIHNQSDQTPFARGLKVSAPLSSSPPACVSLPSCLFFFVRSPSSMQRANACNATRFSPAPKCCARPNTPATGSSKRPFSSFSCAQEPVQCRKHPRAPLAPAPALEQ